MSEFKVGDKVLYKKIDLHGIITGKPSANMWAVFFQDHSSRYCFESELELVERGCMYCKHGEPLNDTSNSNFALVVKYDENDYYIETEYDQGEWNESDYPIIKYCPMCGRKLEVAE